MDWRRLAALPIVDFKLVLVFRGPASLPAAVLRRVIER